MTIEDKAKWLLEYIENNGLTWKDTFGSEDWCRKFGVGSWVSTEGGDVVGRLAGFPEDVEKIFSKISNNTIDDVLSGAAVHAALKEKMGCLAKDIQLNMYGSGGYVADLVKLHEPLHKRLLRTDSDFKEAAEKLAQKLAHALLTTTPGECVLKRKNQSTALFLAAGTLIARVVDVRYSELAIKLRVNLNDGI